ncbi:MAG: type II toxin-antitoxin system VapC family toxin [Candidatus Binatia bacterium]
MQRIVIDTDVYIDWFNDGQHEAVVFQRDAVKYLSSIVVMELAAGAFSVGDRRLIRDVISAFRRARRILLPTASIYEDAGEVLRRLQEFRGYSLSAAYGVVNDVLIALSARSIGATVITQNERHLTAIQTIRSFKLTVIK